MYADKTQYFELQIIAEFQILQTHNLLRKYKD